jgi:hypothetical protein
MFAVNFDMIFILAVIRNIHEYVFALIPQPKVLSIIKYQAFSPSYDLGPPPSPAVSKLSLILSLPVCRRSSFLTGEEGEEFGMSQIMRRRESLELVY